MRSDRDLGYVLLNNKIHFKHGLCHWINRLYTLKLLTEHERMHLLDKVDKTKPKSLIVRWFYNPHGHKPDGLGGNFYWTYGDIKPRVKWVFRVLLGVKNVSKAF